MPSKPKGEPEKVYLSGIGAHLPDHLVTNDTISKLTGIDPAWIQNRTGIRRRYFSKAAERTSQLATWAIREALAQAGVAPGEVDLLLVASSFPDPFPPGSTGDAVKHKLGLTRAQVVDINTPLAGFLYALRFAQEAIATGSADTALIVGAESFSAASDLNDRRVCYLFSDGAGAMLLTRKKGFATVGPVRVGAVSGSDHPGWCEPDWGDRASFTLCGPNVLGLEELLHQAVDEVAGPKPLPTTVHVISQQVSQTKLRKELRPGAQVFDGFSDCAYLLSASLPVSLYHLLRWGEAKDRDRAILFATDGKGTWCANLLDILTTPTWSEAGGPAPRVGKIPVSRAPGPDSREVVSCTREDAQRLLESEACRADPKRSGLVCLALKLQLTGAQGRDLKAQVERETRTILTGSTRASDSLIRLEGGTSYAVLLREVDLVDAQRLARRLASLLEEMDLAGEISVKVESQVNALAADHTPQAFAREVLAGLGQRAKV